MANDNDRLNSNATFEEARRFFDARIESPTEEDLDRWLGSRPLHYDIETFGRLYFCRADRVHSMYPSHKPPPAVLAAYADVRARKLHDALNRKYGGGYIDAAWDRGTATRYATGGPSGPYTH